MDATLKEKTMDTAIDAVNETADEIGGDVRADYSGRGMYGKECYGIVCSDPTRCIEVAATKGLKGARVDSMGTRTIVYWPRISG